MILYNTYKIKGWTGAQRKRRRILSVTVSNNLLKKSHLNYSGITSNHGDLNLDLKLTITKKLSINGILYNKETQKKFPKYFEFAFAFESLVEDIKEFGKKHKVNVAYLFDGKKLEPKVARKIIEKYEEGLDSKKPYTDQVFAKFFLVIVQKLHILRIEYGKIKSKQHTLFGREQAIYDYRISKSIDVICFHMDKFSDFMNAEGLQSNAENKGIILALDGIYHSDNEYLKTLSSHNRRYSLLDKLKMIEWASLCGNNHASSRFGFKKNYQMLHLIYHLTDHRLLHMQNISKEMKKEQDRILVPNVSAVDLLQTIFSCLLRAYYGMIQEPSQKEKAKRIFQKKVPEFFCP